MGVDKGFDSEECEEQKVNLQCWKAKPLSGSGQVTLILLILGDLLCCPGSG